MRQYANLQCRDRNHWGICYIENAECDWYSHIDMSLTLQIEGHEFTMPMRNLMDDITIAGTKYCRLLVANDKYDTPNVVKIGDAFFKGFNSIFDVSSERLGLAVSRFGLPGNRIDIDWWVVIEDEIEAEQEREEEEREEEKEPEVPTTDPVTDPSIEPTTEPTTEPITEPTVDPTPDPWTDPAEEGTEPE